MWSSRRSVATVRSSVLLSHRLYRLKPITSTSEMMWHLECRRVFEVNRNCKKNYPVLWQTDHKEYGGMGQREAWCCYTSVLHICCTMWANGSLRSAEMRNFSAAECRKAMKGNLRSVLHLIFCKLPLDNFPHSVKYPHPLGGELLPLSNKLFWVRDPHPNSAPYP